MIKRWFSMFLPKGSNKLLFISAALLALMGVVYHTSASMNTNTQMNDLILTATKSLAFLVVSYWAMVRIAHIFSFRSFSKYNWLFIIITLLALFAPRLWKARNGAYNWIPVPGFGTIQPSEFAKIVVMLLLAQGFGVLPVAAWMKDKAQLKRLGFLEPIKRIWSVIWIPFTVSLLYFLIILFVQKDLGSAMVIFFIAMVITFMAVHPFLKNIQRILLAILLIGTAGIALLISPLGVDLLYKIGLQEYQISRITNLYNLFDTVNSYDTGFQQVKGLLSFSHGGMFGVGLGKSINKYILPESQTDYILAIIVEESGFLAFIAILVLYGIMIYVLLNYSMKVNDERGRLFLIGNAAYLFFHFVINVGGVTVLIPLTGIPLLMLSQGGSSLLTIFITLGISQNIIARYENSLVKGRR